jgi:crotonobetainyl-CoA:carnitine CoA-transferase CaiB-like acyl-CoA transferase
MFKQNYPNFGDALVDIFVVELGSREAVGVCGCLLAQAGARVVLFEFEDQAVQGWKWSNRVHFATGKLSVLIRDRDCADEKLLIAALKKADVVLLSSDVDPIWRELVDAHSSNDAIICDLTAFGRGVPFDGPPATDKDIQALTGVAETTGFTDGPPVMLNVPVMEYSAGMYGASAILTALLARKKGWGGQIADVSLYDCGVNSLVTFLPAYFGGGEPRRLGNGHAMASPWNAYSAHTGWVLLCSATDAQWAKLCDAMDRPDLKSDARFAELSDRVGNRAEVDTIVNSWMASWDASECAKKLSEFNVPNGLILPVTEIDREPNLNHRSMVASAIDPERGAYARIAGTMFKTAGGNGRSALEISARDDGRAEVLAILGEERRGISGPAISTAIKGMPLGGLKVVEIGQYTTAPLVSRHMATLGAEVIKVEPPAGDAARNWPPKRDGLSLFFVLSNNGKESVVLDLKCPAGRGRFIELIKSADVFVENLRPGSMARIGLDPATLARVNNRLIYCQITGFGMDSVYDEKPAYDTVIQAMSGMMDANSHNGVPMKAGISAGDFLGGEAALFAVLAALWQRDSTDLGQYIDLSMQDVAAWVTGTLWNRDATASELHARLVSCSDGYVYCSSEEELSHLPDATMLARSTFVAQCADAIVAVPILRVSEVANRSLTLERELLLQVPNETGSVWPAVNSPMRLSKTPPVVNRAIEQPRRAVKICISPHTV